MKRYFMFMLIPALLLGGCVTQKKFNDLQKKCNDEISSLTARNLSLGNENTELGARVEQLGKEVESLKSDTAQLGQALRVMNANHLELKKEYDLLSETNSKMKTGNKADMEKLLKELQTTQNDLLAKEDELKKLAGELSLKKQNLDKLTEDLKIKESKLNDLQNILHRKDSVVNALRKKVSDALFGFENKGLTITKKNGKVYVSMEDKLLFASASWEVATNGVAALKKLAKVLEDNQDINVMIEGHTDNVPYNGTGQVKDNWDLSVMRATAVLKILLNNSKTNPSRLTAAGRSQYFPVDAANTKEARSKNRRTEIILTPKLDELFSIIESN